MRRGVVALACLFAIAAPRPAAADLEKPTESQKQAIYAKASVVRVVGYWEVTFDVAGQRAKEYVGGMGSGFFISSDGFIATNAHVVEDIKNGERAAVEKALTALFEKYRKANPGEFEQLGRERLGQLARQLAAGARAVPNAEIVMPDGTKLPYEVRAYGAPVGEGKDVAIIKVDIKDAPNLVIGDSERASVQDKVLAIGYPGAADMQGLLDSKSQLEATITDGAVSAIKRTTDGEPVLQVSVPITHGNSGGPAINERGEVIGLATFGSRGEVQGFNFLVAASTVKKFIKQARADTAPSKTIQEWRKGLDLMWAGDLDASLQSFEEVLTLFPTHSEAPRLMKHVRQMKKEGKGKKSEDATSEGGGSSSGAGAAVAVVIVILLIGLVAVVIIKAKGKKQAPGMPIGHRPGAPMPGMHPGAPMQPPPGAPMQPPPGAGYAPAMPGVAAGAVAGRGQAAPQPVAKTMAIGQHAQVAATAFGSLALGSLTCVRGLLNGQRFSLTPQGILIGRQPGVAQIVVNDSRASGKHVWIGFENGALVAIDQGTTNGTFVNDVRNGRISKAPLKDGDVVIVAEPDCLSLQLRLGQ